MGIFSESSNIFQEYEGELQFNKWVMGGVPRNPEIVEAWLRTKWKDQATDDDIKQAVLRTLREQGIAVEAGATYEQVVAASKDVAQEHATNGFKRDPERGLYLESRCLKAALKEAMNVCFGAERMGPTRKGAKSFLAERVFPSVDDLYFGMQEPTGLHLFIGHTSGPQGRQSNLTYHEYCERPRVRFRLKVLYDAIPSTMWPVLWTFMEMNGLGALRSQGFGTFDLLKWEPVTSGKVRKAKELIETR